MEYFILLSRCNGPGLENNVPSWQESALGSGEQYSTSKRANYNICDL